MNSTNVDLHIMMMPKSSVGSLIEFGVLDDLVGPAK